MSPVENETSNQSKGRKLSSMEIFFIVFVTIILIFDQLAIGGGDNFTSICIVTFYGLATAGLAAFHWARRAVLHSSFVGMPAILFMLAIVCALLSMSHLNAERNHSVGSLVGGYSSSSIDQSRTLLEVIKLFGIACAFLVGFAIGISGTRARFTFQSLGILGALFGLASIVTFAIAPTTLMGFGHKELFPDRLTASFLSANTAGTFFGSCVVLALCNLLTSIRAFQYRKQRGRWIESIIERCAIPTIAIIAAATALLLSASRTAMFATGFAVLLLILAEGLSRLWSLRALLAALAPIIVIGLAAASLVGGGAVMQRLNLLRSDSLVRTHIYQAHIAAMRPFPWFGFGLGTFETVNRGLLATNIKDYDDLWLVRAMHNVYLQWIEGAGLLGALPMFACIGVILSYMAWGAIKQHELSTEIWTVLAISLLILIHGLTDFALENYSIAGWWAILLGVGYSSATRQRGVKWGGAYDSERRRLNQKADF